MSLTDRLAELYELLVGLGVAAVILALIAWIIGATGSVERNGDGTADRALTPEPSQEKNPAEHQERQVPEPRSGTRPDPPAVAALYTAPGAGRPMERADRVEAVAGRGLVGDRYYLEKGHWSGTDDCEVTIIAQEDIDEIERLFDVRIQNGEHRRNMVVRNLPVDNLIGRRFHIGSASFGYERPRPPCAYIQMVSEPGMTKALGKRGGVCVRCIKSGVIREGDQVVISKVTLLQALKYRAKVMLRRWQSNDRSHG